MNKIAQKIGLNEKLSKNFFAIIVVAFGGAIIYGLPYFRYDYYCLLYTSYMAVRAALSGSSPSAALGSFTWPLTL